MQGLFNGKTIPKGVSKTNSFEISSLGIFCQAHLKKCSYAHLARSAAPKCWKNCVVKAICTGQGGKLHDYYINYIYIYKPETTEPWKIVGTMPAPLLMLLMISDTILTENVIHSEVRSKSLANKFSSRSFFFSLSLLLQDFHSSSLILVLIVRSLPLSKYPSALFVHQFGLSFQHVSPSRNQFSKCSQLS